jgi:hypothetical protein
LTPATGSPTLQLNSDLKNIASLSPPPAPPQTGQPASSPTYAPQTTFRPGPVTSPQNTGIFGRIENATSFANSACKTDPTCQQSKVQLEATAAAAGVGCAVGAALGGTAGAAAGGVPAVPGAVAGCAAGAATGEAVLSAAQTTYQVAETVAKIINHQPSAQSVAFSATDVLADVADQATTKIPVSTTVEYGGSWGTYFAYAFYTNTPGN